MNHFPRTHKMNARFSLFDTHFHQRFDEQLLTYDLSDGVRTHISQHLYK